MFKTRGRAIPFLRLVIIMPFSTFYQRVFFFFFDNEFYIHDLLAFFLLHSRASMFYVLLFLQHPSHLGKLFFASTRNTAEQIVVVRRHSRLRCRTMKMNEINSIIVVRRQLQRI